MASKHDSANAYTRMVSLKNLRKGCMTSKKDSANSHTRMMSLKHLGKGFMTSTKDPANTHTRMMSLKNLGKGLKSMRTRTWKDSCVIQLPSQLSWYLSLSRKPMESNLCNVQTINSHHYQLPHLCQTKNNTVVSLFFSKAVPLKQCLFLSPVFLLLL